MGSNNEFRDFVLDQLSGMGGFETKNMFGGTAVLKDGVAFAKIKQGTLWLKVNDKNIENFTKMGMKQYTYGNDNQRKLNFYEAPAEVLENADQLVEWASRSFKAAVESRK
ncbi:MAG: TfoX/Sxy family protein [Leptospiraceae bacterium]|nr:TfoX/Sxy family protein [Myxococcales bacterium]MCP5501312.1 TfoX/Sxy family protein [Leptospiraceae bacterium]